MVVRNLQPVHIEQTCARIGLGRYANIYEIKVPFGIGDWQFDLPGSQDQLLFAIPMLQYSPG